MPDASVTVYTRENCHLCETAIGTIREVAADEGVALDLDLVDVDTDPDLQAEYGERVPFVLVDGRPAFKYHVDERRLREKLTA